MRVLARCLIVTCLLLPDVAFAARPKRQREPPAFPKQESVLKWLNGYRSEPEPDRLPAAVKAMSEHGLLRDVEQAGLQTGFIAGVLGSNPDKAYRLVAGMFPLPPDEQLVLIKAIAFSRLPNWKAVLVAFRERMPARKVLIEKYLFGDGKTLFDLPLDEGAFVLDAHWGYYFGSGSEDALGRIISALQWSKEGDNVERLTIAAMAKWTLASNATRDKILLDDMKAQSKIQTNETVRTALTEVIYASETFETAKLRREALASIDDLKMKGPESRRNFNWWGQAGQTVFSLGCVAAAATGQVGLGIPCVLGGALSSAALKYLGP